jgi:hypothetical protein
MGGDRRRTARACVAVRVPDTRARDEAPATNDVRCPAGPLPFIVPPPSPLVLPLHSFVSCGRMAGVHVRGPPRPGLSLGWVGQRSSSLRSTTLPPVVTTLGGVVRRHDDASFRSCLSADSPTADKALARRRQPGGQIHHILLCPRTVGVGVRASGDAQTDMPSRGRNLRSKIR